MTEVWQQIATQLPVVAAMALLILQLRKSETEERRARHENWQAFLKARDEQWQEFLIGVQNKTDAVHALLINELVAVGKQMQAVTAQMQAVQLSVERFAAIQECNTTEMREFLRRYRPDDDQQPRHP